MSEIPASEVERVRLAKCHIENIKWQARFFHDSSRTMRMDAYEQLLYLVAVSAFAESLLRDIEAASSALFNVAREDTTDAVAAARARAMAPFGESP